MIFNKKPGKHNREEQIHKLSSANRDYMDTPDREYHLSKGTVAPQNTAKK